MRFEMGARSAWELCQINPDRYGLARGRPENHSVGSADQAVLPVEVPSSSERVVVSDHRSLPAVPPATYFHSHLRVGQEVLHVVAAVAVFRDDPEHRSIKTVTYRGESRSSTAASGRLQQRKRPWSYAKAQQEPVRRVEAYFSSVR